MSNPNTVTLTNPSLKDVLAKFKAVKLLSGKADAYYIGGITDPHDNAKAYTFVGALQMADVFPKLGTLDLIIKLPTEEVAWEVTAVQPYTVEIGPEGFTPSQVPFIIDGVKEFPAWAETWIAAHQPKAPKPVKVATPEQVEKQTARAASKRMKAITDHPLFAQLTDERTAALAATEARRDELLQAEELDSAAIKDAITEVNRCKNLLTCVAGDVEEAMQAAAATQPLVEPVIEPIVEQPVKRGGARMYDAPEPADTLTPAVVEAMNAQLNALVERAPHEAPVDATVIEVEPVIDTLPKAVVEAMARDIMQPKGRARGKKQAA